MSRTDVERELRAVAEQLAGSLPGRARHPLRALDDKAIARSTEDAELRAALFRLVDVTPACRSLDDLARHLSGYLEHVGEPPPPVAGAMRIAGTRAGRAALGAAAAAGVRHMAHRFIVGETPERTVGELRRMWDEGVAASVDLLGEATLGAGEADRYAGRCEHALEVLAGAFADLPARPLLDADSSGPVPRSPPPATATPLPPV